MATWEGEAWLGSASGRQKVRVQSNTSYGAKEQMVRIYGADPNNIVNIRQVRDEPSGFSSGGSTEGYGIWICILGAFILFAIFTPWVLMTLFGGIGWWIGEKITGMSAEEYIERKDDTGHKRAALILALSLILGGVGFVQGDKIQKDFDSETTVEEVKSK